MCSLLKGAQFKLQVELQSKHPQDQQGWRPFEMGDEGTSEALIHQSRSDMTSSRDEYCVERA